MFNQQIDPKYANVVSRAKDLSQQGAIGLQPQAFQGFEQAMPVNIADTLVAVAAARLQDRCAGIYSLADRLERIADRVFGEVADKDPTGNAPSGPGQAGQLDHAFNCTDAALARIERAVSRLERV